MTFSELLQYFGVVAVLVAAAIVFTGWIASIFIARALGFEESNLTTASLILGVVASTLLATLLFFELRLILSIALPDGFEPTWPLLVGPGAISLMAGTALFIVSTFDIDPGEKGYGSLAGVPKDLKFGRGVGSIPPLLMEVEKKVSKAKELDLPEQVFTTSNGLTVTVNIGVPWWIEDPLLSEDIEDEDEETYLTKQVYAATHDYLIQDSPDLDKAFSDDVLTRDEAWALVKELAQFKSKTVHDGSEWIHERILDKCKKYGIGIGPVQLENIRLDAKIESTIASIFDEALQKAELKQDADNKAVVVDTLMQVYKKAGVDMTQLPAALHAELVDRQLDRALAIEGKATVKRINFGGQQPERMLTSVE